MDWRRSRVKHLKKKALAADSFPVVFIQERYSAGRDGYCPMKSALAACEKGFQVVACVTDVGRVGKVCVTQGLPLGTGCAGYKFLFSPNMFVAACS